MVICLLRGWLRRRGCIFDDSVDVEGGDVQHLSFFARHYSRSEDFESAFRRSVSKMTICKYLFCISGGIVPSAMAST